MHPYESYIETKAEDYYSRQAHEPHCEILKPYDYSGQTDSIGFVYDIYIPPRCDCWLTINYEDLTLAHKFEALRALSHRYGLHSPACSRLKRTPITYRGKPEVMTGWCDCWLSVDMQPDPSKSCPVCAKPLFFAPNAPQDSAKKACSDLNCVNAHGIIHHDPFDRWETVPVEYDQQPKEQRKDHTMNSLDKALTHADEFKLAQRNIDTFLAPFIKDFAAFMTEHNARGFDLRDFNADTFVEIDGTTFYLKGEEEYSFGEYYEPTLNLPFAFVEDSAAYKADFLKTQAEIESKKKAEKDERIARLEAQLARARAED